MMNPPVDPALPPFSSSDDVCPVCKSDRYLNPSMKLRVPPCFHKMCEGCIDRLFSLGPAPCPVCQQILRKTNFWMQTFEDLQVEKELQIRKRISRYFNKRREDFKSLRQYNDYLEEVENMTFNLIYGVDVQETEERIQRFAQENRDLIANNAARQQREERMQQHRRELERSEKEQQHQRYLQQLEEEEQAKRTERDQLIDQLASSKLPAKDIITQRAITLKRSSMRKSAVSGDMGGSKSVLKADSTDYGWLDADHEDDAMDVDSEDYHPLDQLYQGVDGFTLRSDYYDPMVNFTTVGPAILAGGYPVTAAHQRALEAAFTGLLELPPTGLSPNTSPSPATPAT
ncbi:TFIIH/NER complex subunit [Dispira simplex]|nr:TFIIH/NER complex subunit [Dispira simplex]